jgi:hypothetical protein
MRHIANRRMYPRGRPQIEQRLCCWTLWRAGRFAFAIIDFFATKLPRYDDWNGMPSSWRSLRPSSSVLAVVTMLISSPRSRSILS